MSDSFFSELKRRNVFKVGIAYIVLAWVMIQVVDTAVPALHLPEWIITAVFLFGLIGFPFAIFFAWAFEITPDGVKKESEITPEESITHHTSRKLDFVIIGLLVIALGYFIYDSKFADKTIDKNTESLSSSEVVDSSSNVPNKLEQEPEGSSIAVLAFKDMSQNKDHEYFSDGISEEILNVLAKIPNLHVTSRSSAFAFKGKQSNIKEIAAKLGVKNILEGSIRLAGNRVRITAQLIEADTDKHLWSESYDRDMTDIFAVQDEISAAIVDALKSKLGLDVKLVSRDMSKVNLEAHNEYLKGRFYIERRNQKDLETAHEHFNKAIELDNNYAPAWMGKALATYFLGEDNYGSTPVEVANKAAEEAITTAKKLDPTLPEIYAILALLLPNEAIEESKALFEKAIELNPNYADAYSWYGNDSSDNPEKFSAFRKKAYQLNPMSILTNLHLAQHSAITGNFGEVKRLIKQMKSINPNHPFTSLIQGQLATAESRYADAAYFYSQMAEIAPDFVRGKFIAAQALAKIGLGKRTNTLFTSAEYQPYYLYYSGNQELAISQARAIYPRSDNDSLGMTNRAFFELEARDYNAAAKFFNYDHQCDECPEKIYSLKMAGDLITANKLLNKEKSKLQAWTKFGAKFYNSFTGVIPIAFWKIKLLIVDADSLHAIALLKQAVDDGHIITTDFISGAMYDSLRAEPQWPAILKKSNALAKIARDQYLSLIADQG